MISQVKEKFLNKTFNLFIREFNHPKRNSFPDKFLNPDITASLFVKKQEL